MNRMGKFGVHHDTEHYQICLTYAQFLVALGLMIRVMCQMVMY